MKNIVSSDSRKTLLIIGAHHDDGEGAAGGLMLKAVEKNYRVVTVTLTGNHASWEPTAGREKEVREGLISLAKDMGIEKRFYDWGYHELRYDEKAIRQMMELADELKPDIALIHNRYDLWPDHEAAGRIGAHALWFPHHGFQFKDPSKPQLFAFEAGPNQKDQQVPFRPDTYIDVSDKIERIAAIMRSMDSIISGETHTQPTCHERWKLASCAMRGIECGIAYAEAFLSLKKIPCDIL